MNSDSFLVVLRQKKRTLHIRLYFPWLDRPGARRDKVLPLIEAAQKETDEQIQVHNMLYAYRVYLDLNPYPPLPHHMYMYENLPSAPFNKKSVEDEHLE